jgi:lysophospholipase L1-like esterase
VRIAFFGDSLTSGVPGSSYVAILRQRFPDDTLLNFGKGNDTVVSLYRGISAMQFGEPLDLAFLSIGVNDVLQTDRWPFRTFHALLAQRRARDRDEFQAYFRATLDFLCDKTVRVIVAPPALKGENLDNPWNHRLTDPAGLIKEVTAECDRTEFLDVQAAFVWKLPARPGSEHAPRNPICVLLDALTLRTDGQIDAKATERGLHLTPDGVQLNSAGARLVGEEFVAVIHNYRQG